MRLLYPLEHWVPGFGYVPLGIRRRTRRRLTEAAVRLHLARCRRVSIAAVTGSVGKTTTKDLLGEMLASVGPTMRTRKNDNNLYGVPSTLLSIRPTDRFAVIEVGIFHTPGEMPWMAGLFRPRVAVLTGIHEDHLSTYGTRRAVAREKRALFERLGPTGTAVVHADDQLARETVAGLGCNVVLAGRSEDADIRLLGAELSWPAGIVVRLSVGPRLHEVRVALYGVHLAPLVALALGAALACGATVDGALAALARFRPPEGRLHPEAGPNGSMFLRDDYKNRPRSAIAAVRTLGEVPARRRIVVLGEFQPDQYTDADFEPVAAELPGTADLVIVVGRAAGPVRSLLSETPLRDRVLEADGVVEAADLLASELREGDTILLKGATRQHFQRIKLLLEGATVGCRVRRCNLNMVCTDCPYLVTGPPPAFVEAA